MAWGPQCRGEEDRELLGRKGGWRGGSPVQGMSFYSTQAGSGSEGSPKGQSSFGGPCDHRLYLINGQKLWGEVLWEKAKLFRQP